MTLIRKLADRLDGVNVADCQVGDVLDLPASEARLLIAEQWAEPSPDQDVDRRAPQVHPDVERVS